MSEELEGTLREAIESYLSERLRSINEDLSRLQEEFNSTLARLRDSKESLAGTPLEESIGRHLETARTEAAAASASASTGNFAGLKQAVVGIESQRSQVNILNALLSHAAQFAHRAALFVIRNEQAIGWRMCGPAGTISDENMRELVLPLTSDTLLSYVARSRGTWSGEPGSNSEDSSLLEELGGNPLWIAALPLVVRGKTVAVLYADTESSDPDAINLEALETLILVAAMAVDLLSVSRAPKQVSRPEVAQPAAEIERAPAEAMTPEPEVAAIPAVEEPPSYVPETAEVAAPEFAPAPAVEEVAPAPAEEEATPAETVMPAPMIEPAVFEPPSPVLTSAPSFGSEYSAPLGTKKRWGQAEAELPIEVGDDERRFHTDARRFARLLVSEIKLYNEQKVMEGQNRGDIYDRLREDIDRSRQMYEKRIAPPVAERYDYFHHELVRTLAGGDSGKLGASYPGATVAMV